METNYGLDDWEDSQTEPWGDDDEQDQSMDDPMAYHQCLVCKKPMKRVETANYGPGWVFDCKCLDAVPPQSDAEAKHG
jgi:hypothetical protein